MNLWSLTNATNEKLYFEWLLYHQVLVKIHTAGQYPILMRKDGTFDNGVPHIEVILGHFFENNKNYYSDVTVRIYSPKKDRPSIVITIWKSGAQPKSMSADILINLAKMQFSLALDRLNNITNEFKMSKARVKEARAYPTIFETRSEYESVCQKLNIKALPDEICQSYGIQYGTFRFPEYNGDHCLEMKMARRRLRGILKEQKANPTQIRSLPIQGKQLWQPCKICEREPSYLSLQICEHCWPKE